MASPVAELSPMVVTPALLTENNVVVAVAVEEAMANNVVSVEPLLLCIDNLAKGDVVPTPSAEPTAVANHALPELVRSVDEALPKVRVPKVAVLALRAVVEAKEEKKDVVVALVPVALANTKLPVRVVDESVVPVKVLVPVQVLESASSVEEAAVMVMLAVPSKVTPLMVRPVWSAVAVEALPVKLPTTPPLAFSTPPTLRTEEMVEEPVTARAVVVAPAAVRPPLKAMAVVVALEGNG